MWLQRFRAQCRRPIVGMGSVSGEKASQRYPCDNMFHGGTSVSHIALVPNWDTALWFHAWQGS